MNTGTKIRTALAVAIALYTAFMKTDVTEFNNDVVNLIYQICMKIVTFVVIFLITYYNNDYTPEACEGTGVTRQRKAEKESDYIGDYFYTDEEGDDNEQDDLETGGQQVGEEALSD